MSTPPCPCGGPSYEQCCQPLHQGSVQAATAEQLMRSRYSAFVLRLDTYLWRTWHPRTRPEQVETGGVHWTGLRIVDVVDGQPDDDAGVVEFVASYLGGQLRERSRFEKRARRWFYLDAEG